MFEKLCNQITSPIIGDDISHFISSSVGCGGDLYQVKCLKFKVLVECGQEYGICKNNSQIYNVNDIYVNHVKLCEFAKR